MAARTATAGAGAWLPAGVSSFQRRTALQGSCSAPFQLRTCSLTALSNSEASLKGRPVS